MTPLSRRQFVHHLGLAAAAATCVPGRLRATPPGPVSLAGSRPNILLIMADDLGFADLGCYGATIVETPNLDRLGFGGTRFTQCYNNAKCAPSRATLLTGLYSQQVGCHGPPVTWRHCATLAEALQPAGYRSWLSGKWHAGQSPHDRGFEREFALCNGHCNYWNGAYASPVPPDFEPDWYRTHRTRWAFDGVDHANWAPDAPNFFTTDAFSDAAVRFITAGADDPAPFLLHLAYTAPHFPLQAPPEDIAKYRGRFRDGWDAMRARRHARQLELGLLDPAWPLSARDEATPPWDDVAEQDRDDWDLRMAVYAAMIDRMDRGIGRVLDALDATGQRDNTLILFLSDNGGNAEEFNRTPDVAPGPIASFRTLDPPWAGATNTPFRKYKTWNHEGGISTPLIAHWPGRVPAGRICGDVVHILDFMPTCLELAGAAYPTENAGEPVLPLEGRSFVPALAGQPSAPRDLLCWQFGGAAAARRGRWKVVRLDRKSGWELYDVEADRTETRNLAAVEPARTAALVADWEAWARRVGGRL